jgi:hypothetical protein
MKTFWIRTGTFLFVVASFATPALAQDNSARLLTAVPVDSREGVQTVVTPRQLRGFSVVLVEGDLRGANATEGLPAAATKALADVKDFLPYKGYRLLDTQWTLGHGKQAIRLRASVDQEYDLELESSYPYYGSDGARAAQSLKTTQIPRVAITRFQLRAAIASAAATLKEDRGQLAIYGDTGPASLIETTFRMDVGETVVVGTSRLQGDKALVVLLTAVSR